MIPDQVWDDMMILNQVQDDIMIPDQVRDDKKPTMSELSANSIMPLISALPDEEQYALSEKLARLLKGKRKPKKKKKEDIYDKLPEKFHPDNTEILVSEIMYGK